MSVNIKLIEIEGILDEILYNDPSIWVLSVQEKLNNAAQSLKNHPVTSIARLAGYVDELSSTMTRFWDAELPIECVRYEAERTLERYLSIDF